MTSRVSPTLRELNAITEIDAVLADPSGCK